MTEQQIAAVRQALEALEEVKAHRGPALWGGCFALEIAALRHILEQSINQSCQCPACKIVPHSSDCAVHSEPAYPAGKCDCGGYFPEKNGGKA